MRILVCELSSSVAAVARQPMYEALASAGNELAVLVATEGAEFAAQVAPMAQIIRTSFASPAAAAGPGPMDLVAIGRFKPDLILLSAPLASAWLDALTAAFPTAAILSSSTLSDRRGGLADRRHIPLGIGESSHPATAAPTPAELLCAEVRGEYARLPDPKLTPTATQLRQAEAFLERLGLRAGEYWVARVDAPAQGDKGAWATPNWAGALGTWATRFDRKFLLLQPADAQWFPYPHFVQDGHLGIDLQVGLTHLSRGYVGGDHDTLPLAAALGKPVLAVVSGEQWPLPVAAVDPSCVLSVAVACAGCGGDCPFTAAHCAREVPVADFLQAVEDLEASKLVTREARQCTATPELLSKMVKEARAATRTGGPTRTEAGVSSPESQVTPREVRLRAKLSSAYQDLNELRAQFLDLQDSQQHAAATAQLRSLEDAYALLRGELLAAHGSRWWRAGHFVRRALRRVRRLVVR